MKRTPIAKRCPTCDAEVFRLRSNGVCGKCANSSDAVVTIWKEATVGKAFVQPEPVETALETTKPSVQELEREIKDNGWFQVHIDKGLKKAFYVTAIGYHRQTGEQRAVKIKVFDVDTANDLLEKEWMQL